MTYPCGVLAIASTATVGAAENPTTRTPTFWRNSRRVLIILLHRFSGAFDGPKYRNLRPASAFEAAKRSPYLVVGRFLNGVHQVSGIHEPAILASAALRHLFVNPCLLYGMKVCSGETFECCDLVPGGRADGCNTGTNRLSIQMHGARAALAEAASEPRAAQV